MMSHSPAFTRWLLTIAVFFGAFLLFSVEFLVANLLTPRFGGGAVTWLTALMFFQVVLFFGYAYAHYLAPQLKAWHLAVIALAGLMLPVSVSTPPIGSHPILEVIWAISWAVLLPFFVLSTTSVVMQIWWVASSETEGEPYPLYAASNFGSVIALLAYPLLIDPLLGLNLQRWLWALGYLVFIGIVLACWLRAKPQISPPSKVKESQKSSPTMWLVWSILPSTFLLSVTNYIVSDVGSFPLLWTLPLLAYLLSFIVVFSEKLPLGWTKNWWPEIVVLSFLSPLLLATKGVIGIVFMVLSLFLLSTALHQILYEQRPKNDELSRYFLWISAGGALGGIIGNLLPPLLFPSAKEVFFLLIIIAAALALWVRKGVSTWLRNAPLWMGTPRLMGWGLTVFIIIVFIRPRPNILDVRRNVYGSIKVVQEHINEDQELIKMLHGNTVHGQALLGQKKSTPVAYYYHGSGIHDAHEAMRSLKPQQDLSMGLIGLGAGSMAEYVRPGDTLTVYELNPLVVALAKEYFPYLKQSLEPVDVQVGDGLLLLNGSNDTFDVLTVDAFSGDAIPLNLMTLEAMEIYFKHLQSDGVLVFHVTNRYFSLPPILGRTMDALGLSGAYTQKQPKQDASLTDLERITLHDNLVVAMSREPQVIERLMKDNGWSPLHSDGGQPWTDDSSNALEALLLVRHWMGWPTP